MNKTRLLLILALGSAISIATQAGEKKPLQIITPRPIEIVKNNPRHNQIIDAVSNWVHTHSENAKVTSVDKIFSLIAKCEGNDLYTLSSENVTVFLLNEGFESNGNFTGSAGSPAFVISTGKTSRLLFSGQIIKLVGIEAGSGDCPNLLLEIDGFDLGRAGNQYGFIWAKYNKITKQYERPQYVIPKPQEEIRKLKLLK